MAADMASKVARARPHKRNGGEYSHGRHASRPDEVCQRGWLRRVKDKTYSSISGDRKQKGGTALFRPTNEISTDFIISNDTTALAHFWLAELTGDLLAAHA